MLTLSPQERREVAAEACCDERTVGRYLRRERLRSSCSTRIERALRRLGIEARVAPHAPTPNEAGR